MMNAVPPGERPFSAFAAEVCPQSPLRAAITRHDRTPEPDCVAGLVREATLPPPLAGQVKATAERLIRAVRTKGPRGTVEGLISEYDLSSQEGVALMCLAEALLRVPDVATRDALIRDKIGGGDWRRHLGHSPSMFVNAATWGLVVTGKLTGTSDEDGLGAAVTRLLARGGEPLIRRGADMAMRMMGEQFVAGEDISAALRHARRLEARGFRYSYDMLGEAAMTGADAARYFGSYERAIHAIGKAAGARGPYEGPGISIKLSALHPRYTRSQRQRVVAELLPRLRDLALLARQYEVGLNIDAEEADRLELSLDLLEALCFDPALGGWNGIGFVVQAYQKRAPFVLDWVIDLARRSGHRLMLRLVKGAYWDSEIKRAQVDGMPDFPVFTRKVHTDVSYLACARKLLAAPDAVFPQFATHNAQTVAAILGMAGPGFHVAQYEFQCLHGMGETLYEEVVGPDRLDRPCRIYAPVGTHETLLAYLVRRLLENGANSSFVNRINDPDVPVADLSADPVTEIATADRPGLPHGRIALPGNLFAPDRVNSAGLDLNNERHLAALVPALQGERHWTAGAEGPGGPGPRPVLNPADPADVVGQVAEATDDQVDDALAQALDAAPAWQATAAADRAACLLRAADLLEARRPALLGLIVREAGKSLPNAVGEVREAVDFLRYYATQAAGFGDGHVALGPVTCISPWNFPLAIFVGQVAAALVAGNTVLAKPAEETPLVAAQAAALLHEAGVPARVLHLLAGPGSVGARLVADPRTRAVVFTGSTEVARLIQRSLAERLNPDGSPVMLVAETGGQNAMVVDSSALPEQVVADVLVSAFDSAGQRCSALRVLCLQEDVADTVLTMLRGALAELVIGNPDRLSTDVGPVISAEARDRIEAHVLAMRERGHPVHRVPLPAACARGTFVAPTIIEIPDISALTQEVFGPVLHVLRFPNAGLDDLLRDIGGTGYGLTFGLHTRVDETVTRVTRLARAGNLYVNRNLIGAVVGVQPFGGHGLSGTGPKAGGPLYVRRMLARSPANAGLPAQAPECAAAWTAWLRATGMDEAARRFLSVVAETPAGTELELPGPVGERNVYRIQARGRVTCVAANHASLIEQVGAVVATGNLAVIDGTSWGDLPHPPSGCVTFVSRQHTEAVVLFDGRQAELAALCRRVACQDGSLIPIVTAGPDGRYPLDRLVTEWAVSTNTTAGGGNAQLMMVG